VIALLCVFGLLVWAGAATIIDGWMRFRRGRDLAGHLLPFQRQSIGDEAQEWLNSGPRVDEL
jgi:hypothetical protein